MKLRTLVSSRWGVGLGFGLGFFAAITNASAQSGGDPTAPPPAGAPDGPSTGRPVDPLADIPPASPPHAPAQETAPIPGQPAAVPGPAPSTATYYVGPPPAYRVGGALLVGGGFEDFTAGNLHAMTGGGGSWTARFVGGTREIVGLEAAYVGAAHSFQTLGLAPNSNLVSNGVEGALRLNLPIVRGATLLEPFGFIGLGWQHYTVTNGGTSTVASSDDVMTLPYGAGMELSYRSFMVDARFTYRQTYRNDLLRAEGGRLNTWGVGGNVGVEF